MKLAFAGTPAFSVPALQALHDAGHEIVGVFTQPDRPAGRGRKLSASAVSQAAEALGLPVFKPVRLRNQPDAIEQIAQLQAEAMVVVAYGLILPQQVLDIPPRGCINIHASLLPRWRGAAPIQRAIEAGDAQTGVTIMQMDAGLDTGPMLLRRAIDIGDQETAGALQDRLSTLGAQMIVEAMERLNKDALPATAQPEQGATYASKIDKQQARLNWSLDAETLSRKVRAFHPVPGAWTMLGDQRLRIHRALKLALPCSARPGKVIDVSAAGVQVATGDGLLSLQVLQWPGGKALDAAQIAQRGKLQASAGLT